MAKITEIHIDINGKKIVLSLEAARELHETLGELFEEKEDRYWMKLIPVYPQPGFWQVPYIGDGAIPNPYGTHYTITCSANGE